MGKYAKSASYYFGIPAIVIFWLLRGQQQFTQMYSENQATVSLPRRTEVSLDSKKASHFGFLTQTRQPLLVKKAGSVVPKTKAISHPNEEQKTLKTILMWSNWDKWFADGVLAETQCPVTSCLFTSDVTLLNQSDVVVFYIDTSTNFPLNRNPRQRFVFFNLEPPNYSSRLKISDPRVRYRYFNWTMTYRWDSDIIFRSNYGYMSKKSISHNNSEMKFRARRIWDLQTSGQKWQSVDNYMVPKIKNIDLDQIKKKGRLIAWFVSNCFAPSRREEYVQQLSQYVPVDIFGTCTMRNCSDQCDDMLRSHYKFYLAFENSFCPDYVTEKFYRALQYDTVPIVLGGADYNLFAPQHSYIDIKDFSSPKDLAEYLIMLNQSDSLYSNYFHWKNDYHVIMPDNYGLCDLCRMAQNNSLETKVYNDIKSWWFEERNCKNPL